MIHLPQRATRRLSAIAVASVVALALAACSSSDADSDSSDDQLTVGFSNPTAENTYLGPLQDAMQKTVEAGGGKFIGIDAKVDPNKQISDIQTLITQGVDVLVVYPLDPRGVGPVLQQAQDKGIKILGFNADITKDVGSPPDAPYLGQVYDGFVSQPFADEQVKWVTDNVQGKVLYAGLGVPVPALERHAELVIDGLESAEGIEYVGRVDSKTDDIQAAVAPISAALTKNPDLAAIVTYSDASALGAAAAVKAAGKEGEVTIISSQLQDPGVEAIRDGSIDVTYDFQNILLGQTLGTMAMEAGNGGDESEYATTVYPGVQQYTQENIDSFVGWEQQLADLE